MKIERGASVAQNLEKSVRRLNFGPAVSWSAGVALVLAFAYFVAIPAIASTRVVRESIAIQLSDWSGYRVTLGQAPTIEIWPKLRAVLHDVHMSDWKSTAADNPVISAPQVDIDLSPLAALSGRVEFSTARFVSPTLHLDSDETGYSAPDLPLRGRFAQAVGQARLALALNPNNPNLGDLPDDLFGGIDIVDGSVVTGSPNKPVRLAEKINGVIGWPALNRPGRLSGSGLWRGEPVRLDLQSDQPLMLLAGGQAKAAGSFSAKPLTASFEGSLRAGDTIDGKIDFSTPSLGGALAWLGGMLPDGMQDASFSLSSTIAGKDAALKLDQVELALGQNSAIGSLDLSLAGDRPSVSGTLAFQTVDLNETMAVLAPDQRQHDDIASIDELAGVDVDLRVSAHRARLDTVELTDVAASANVADGLSVFDVSDATAFGGAVQVGLRIDRKENKSEFRLSGSDIDGAALAAATVGGKAIPAAPLTFTISLKGVGTRLDTLADHANGSINATFGKGELSALDLSGLTDALRRGGFQPLSEVSSRPTAITGGELKATVMDGVARLDVAEARTGERRLVLGGLVQLAERSLALNGAVLPLADQANGETAKPEARFFIGGSWAAPFVTSVSAPENDE